MTELLEMLNKKKSQLKFSISYMEKQTGYCGDERPKQLTIETLNREIALIDEIIEYVKGK